MNLPSTASADAVVLSRRRWLRPMIALFVLTLRQHLRGRRLLVVSLLFALPSVLAAVVCLLTARFSPPGAPRLGPTADGLEFTLLLNFIPHVLAPLTALLYAAGIIRDDIEEQTLTYLLLRPLPRWALYLMKLLATLVLTAVVTALFALIAMGVIGLVANPPATAATVPLLTRALRLTAMLSLVQVGYCGLFGLLGLLTRRSLLAGAMYIVLFEGLLASLDTVARRLTVMFHFRVLALRWLEVPRAKDWSINLTTAPEAQSCVLMLLGAGLVLAVAAALVFASTEFRMKTPEGN